MNRQPSQAIAPAQGPQPPARACRLLIEDSGGLDDRHTSLSLRFEPLVDRLMTRLDSRPLVAEAVTEYRQFMTLMSERESPDFVYGHSVHVLARLVRDHGFQPLLRRTGAFRAAIVVPRGSKTRRLQQAHGLRLLMPEPHTTAAALAQVELRRHGVGELRTRHLRYPETVIPLLQSGAGDIGVVDMRSARQWMACGGRVLTASAGAPHSLLLAAPHVAPSLSVAVRDSLLRMNTEDPESLERMGIRRWAPATRSACLALLEYLDA